MIAAGRVRPEILAGVAALSLIAAAVFAARAGLALADLRAEEAALAAGEARLATLNTPRAPAGLRPLVAGAGPSLGPRAGEVLNVELGALGLSVSGADTTTRRPFADGLEALFITVRGRGDMAAGLKALAWMRANERSISVEAVQAIPTEGVEADWTFKLIVLGAIPVRTVGEIGS